MGGFVVGGFLPGTNVQFSFQAWVIVMAVLVAVVMAAWTSIKLFFTASEGNVARTYAPSAQELHLGFLN